MKFKSHNPFRWHLPPARKGEAFDIVLTCIIILMFVIGASLGDPCQEMEEPKTQRQQLLCE